MLIILCNKCMSFSLYILWRVVMMWNFQFFLSSFLLGIGLTMDAFSVSVADGLNEASMKKEKMVGIATTFAFFQFAMPMIGWVCVHTFVQKFQAFSYAIPWIALLLLSFIGGKMIYENIKGNSEEEENPKNLTFLALMLQGIATSIDALSVGFTISSYDWVSALVACIIIGLITLLFCLGGLFFGKKIGSKFSKRAEFIGGLILIGIGIEIFISNMIELYA